MCLPPTLDLQDPSLSQGYCAVFCVRPCPWVLLEGICPCSPVISSGSFLGRGQKSPPLPCLSCWQWVSPGGRSVPFGAQWLWFGTQQRFRTSWILFFFPCAPSSEERSFGSRRKHISVRGETKQQWHWELHHAMLMPKDLSLPKFWSSFHYPSVITFYFENFEGWGEEFIFWYSGTSKWFKVNVEWKLYFPLILSWGISINLANSQEKFNFRQSGMGHKIFFFVNFFAFSSYIVMWNVYAQ